jgi:hypothetical protein
MIICVYFMVSMGAYLLLIKYYFPGTGIYQEI